MNEQAFLTSAKTPVTSKEAPMSEIIADDAYAEIKNDHRAFQRKYDTDPHPWTVGYWLHKAGYLARPVTDELVERHAEYLCNNFAINGNRYADVDDDSQDFWRGQARAAIAASREVPE